jgi:transposase
MREKYPSDLTDKEWAFLEPLISGGQKRHLLVDSLGLILLVIVHPANIQDRDGAKMLLRLLTEKFGWLKLIWADGGYAGKLVEWVGQLRTPFSENTPRQARLA